ncbi:hypothetical protein SAMN02910298_02791 [Pseudobutyrivibrio sp. YE44]|uniref:hypothetical protein n=1 Tax=Pseudobutyrivibrio sp. YE44 TaxID=1520802 RepID=UPI000888BB95|nr:hypothetical protein [Pseudobutyrivibrio sp. YE44]SDB54459.1 hypothetical protein SAMN02910298_02791 [Pseudobutyrivibrio sp. YE44]
MKTILVITSTIDNTVSYVVERYANRAIFLVKGYKNSVRYYYKQGVNSDETISAISEEKPDIVVVNGTGIISERA